MRFKLLLLLFSLGFLKLSFAQEILCIESIGSDFSVTWSPPPAPCGPFVSYEVWVSADPAAAFTLIGTVNNELQTTFLHVNAFGLGDPLYYYIIYNYNCPGQPPVISQTATSDFGSYEPEISSLDVTPGGILITWEQSTYVQTAGYVIAYLQPNGLAFYFDTIFGISNTSYLDVNANINDPNLVYTLHYIDGCDNLSGFNTIGYEIIQVNSTQDDCNQLIEYEWQNYSNPYDLGFSYNIYVQVNNGPVELVANQQEFANIFNFFDFIDEDTIQFRVEVIDANGTPRSNSPWLTDTAQIIQPPREFYIYYLSVVNNEQIDIEFYIDTLSELRNMEIDTSKLGNDFDMIERYDASLYPGLGYIYMPDTVSPSYRGARYYQIIANDSCNTNHFSTIGRTIYLKAELNDFFQNKVTWNPFELEDANLTSYRLYRDYGAGLQLVETFAPSESEFEYVDDISAFFNQSGNFCYRVEADYSFAHPDGSLENYTTSSNLSCIEQRPSVYIPNAIAPTGINNEFKPYIVFGNPTNYSMKIFNRWGEMLFESKDPQAGWFGTNNGSPVPTGGYPYVINFVASDGTHVEKKGIVTVVR
ncbi:MAG: gliding motility-associated C-terminal domain-containing protein [Chitinophagales bacterium]|nr:gliding motility-associated C-terminal domain-containing protein [Chitinophagales bacterium]